MEPTQTEHSIQPLESPRVLNTAKLVEPQFINYSYVLDLDPKQSPKFYELAAKISDSITDPTDLHEVVSRISDLAPDTGHPEEFDRVKKTPSNTVPIDSFFTETNPAAQCLERTILTQLVLAAKGVDTTMIGFKYQKGDTFVLHAALEVPVTGSNPQIIDSYVKVTGSDKNEVHTTVTSKEEYTSRYNTPGQ
jgi:hypothetical protein